MLRGPSSVARSWTLASPLAGMSVWASSWQAIVSQFPANFVYIYIFVLAQWLGRACWSLLARQTSHLVIMCVSLDVQLHLVEVKLNFLVRAFRRIYPVVKVEHLALAHELRPILLLALVVGHAQLFKFCDLASLHSVRLHIDLRLVEATVQFEPASLVCDQHCRAHWRLAATAHHGAQLEIFVRRKRSKLAGDHILAGARRSYTKREQINVNYGGHAFGRTVTDAINLQVRLVKNLGLLLWFWEDSLIVTMRLIPGFLMVETR